MKNIWACVCITAGLMSAVFLTSCGGGAGFTPTVATVSAASGPISGGTSVTLTGENFESGATVTFGGAAATSVVVESPFLITATTPSHAPGSVSVVVTNPEGSSGTLAKGFTFVEEPLRSSGGYWIGSVNGETGVGLVDERGTFIFIADDGEQFPGTLLVGSEQGSPPQGDLLSGSMHHFTTGKFPNYGVATCPPPLNTPDDAGAVLSGTIVPRQSISALATFQCQVVAGVSLTFNELYYMPSSLATISGTYKDLATGTVFTINADAADANGIIFAQDASTGCAINGTISIIDSSYNVYGIEVSYASCTGSLTTLNGVTLAGLAALDNTKSPEQLIAGVWQSGPPLVSVNYALVRL